jgi:hypothetical protein
MKPDAKSTIEAGKAILGIEFGSTRIKAVLIDQENKPIAQGSHTWENQLVDGLWTYSVEAIWYGLQDCYADLRSNVKSLYDIEIETLAAIGVSAMMHGYMAFNDKEEILVPFRTWRNTNTGAAAAALSELFVYNIPLRWSISHLYQAILDNEEHVKDIDYLTTLAGFIHWQITGQKVLGIGDASGMLPIDPVTKNYSAEMVAKFDELIAPKGYGWKLLDILPKALPAGENAGFLTPEGAKMLDVSGHLKAGIPVCPPEGDRYGGNQCREAAYRKRIGRYLFVLHDCIGERSVKALRNDRYGYYSRWKSRSHGTLQQLYVRPQCMDQPVQGIPGTAGYTCRYERSIWKTLQPCPDRQCGLWRSHFIQLHFRRTCNRICRWKTDVCTFGQ